MAFESFRDQSGHLRPLTSSRFRSSAETPESRISEKEIWISMPILL